MAGDTQIPCSTDGCPRPKQRRGMCNKHYLAWYRSTPANQRPRPPTTNERFWSKVVKTNKGCWEWTGYRRPSGHGMFAVSQQRIVPAHAFSLELALGYATPTGLICCHRCDNPPCVNPKHLYYGTRLDNSNDAWARGLMPVGSQRKAAKLTEEQVVELRREYAAGGDARTLSDKYGIAVPTLRLTVLGKKWTHVGGPITRRRPSRKAA